MSKGVLTSPLAIMINKQVSETQDATNYKLAVCRRRRCYLGRLAGVLGVLRVRARKNACKNRQDYWHQRQGLSCSLAPDSLSPSIYLSFLYLADAKQEEPLNDGYFVSTRSTSRFQSGS